MRIVKIESLENGAHVNKAGNFSYVPAGYAVIPDSMTLPASFPFVDLEVKEIGGIMTVVSMSEREVPVVEPVKAEPSAQDDTDALLIDHEYRITLLELGVSE